MIITEIKTETVELPLEAPIATAIHNVESIGCVLLTLKTDEGIDGEAYVYTINAARIRAFEEMIKGFSHQLLNRDPHYVGAIWHCIWDEINPTGHKGVTVSAMSAIDVACWDIVGKAADKPLHHIFGACRDSIKTYASGGLWLSEDIETIVEEAKEYVAMGFRGMKVRVGSGNIKYDVARVAAVREAVGPDIELMADVNQALRPKQAIRLGDELEEYHLLWLEEPVAAHDLEGHAKVTASIVTPVASGETEYTRFGMQQMINVEACDVLMPDLQRIGGYSEMLKVAHIASAHNIKISTHVFTEHSLCIAGAAYNCISVEHMPWLGVMFNESMEMRDGEIIIPQRPGTGFTFNWDALDEFII
ncbi:MAG: mandelate racemase/muconate lactonizing enzyme family protein [Gammaproteobacteria bacterium]|nr:mandelate racemase/muconate lactonizing enzyme family protein [Gammaproteobacteria bacterium]